MVGESQHRVPHTVFPAIQGKISYKNPMPFAPHVAAIVDPAKTIVWPMGNTRKLPGNPLVCRILPQCQLAVPCGQLVLTK